MGKPHIEVIKDNGANPWRREVFILRLDSEGFYLPEHTKLQCDVLAKGIRDAVNRAYRSGLQRRRTLQRIVAKKGRGK